MKIGIIGASGYTGSELIRILLNHKNIELSFISSREHKGKKLFEVFPQFKSLCDLIFEDPSEGDFLKDLDLLFVALPHKSAMTYVKKIYEAGIPVVDLSADCRFSSKEIYTIWYTEHTCPYLLKESVYGLPEVYRDKIKGKRIVANPGCYPTSVIIPLYPIVSQNLIKPFAIVDSKTGVSGAGRKADLSLNFCEVCESIRPYNVFSHRHSPEMEEKLSEIGKENFSIFFTPQLVPLKRGILSSIYVELKNDLKEEKIYEIFLEHFSNEPFVRLFEPGNYPKLSQVCGTNFCDISFKMLKRRLVIFSAIDNLIKGASGQAVQNMNILFGFDEREGLINLTSLG